MTTRQWRVVSAGERRNGERPINQTRYRLDYIHYPTSARLSFTVAVDADGALGAIMARRIGEAWFEPVAQRRHEFIFLAVAEARVYAHPQ